MRVVVTSRRVPDHDPYDDLVEEYGGELIYGDCQTERDAVELCADADVIIGGFVPVSASVMDAAGDLTAILVHAAGYDAVDVPEATHRGIPVANAPGYGSDAVACHAIALALAASHHIPRLDRRLREAPGWDRETIYPLQGGTMGIVGLGRIGRKLVPKARGFDMDVIAYDPHLPEDVFELMDVERVGFEQVLERSDCISIHAPLTSVSHGLFSHSAFEQMKESAILINTGRGPIVDEPALEWALNRGEIRAAGLDVFEQEPPDGSPLLDRDDVVLTPHVAGGAEDAHEKVVAIMREELRRVFTGDPLENVVNPSVYQYRGEQVTTLSEEDR